MSLESRISNLEDFIHKINREFLTARIKAQEISEGKRKPEHLGEKTALVLQTETTAFINSYNPDTLTDSEKAKVHDKMKSLVIDVKKSKLSDEDKQSLIARLNQCIGNSK